MEQTYIIVYYTKLNAQRGQVNVEQAIFYSKKLHNE
jgi:hypothetical protein